jgi:hypothetical protein
VRICYFTVENIVGVGARVHAQLDSSISALRSANIFAVSK